jgi:beta-galactosidase
MIKLFLDGEQVVERTATGSIKRSFHPITIGKNHERDAENQPGFISNAVFDEVRIYDQAISPDNSGFFYEKVPQTENLVLWLKMDTFEEKGEYLCYGATPSHSATMDGIIFSDRRLQPESYQVKISHTPVLFRLIDPVSYKVSVDNGFHFTNLNEFSLQWSLIRDSTILQTGKIREDIPAQLQKAIHLPLDEFIIESGSEYRLLLSLLLENDTWWADKSYEITFKEFLLENDKKKIPLEREGADTVTFEQQDKRVIIGGPGFQYEINLMTGRLNRIGYQDSEMVLDGPELNVFRPWIVNEISHWTRAEFDEWYEWGLDSLIHKVEKYEIKEVSPSQLDISFNVFSVSFIDPTIQFINHYNYSIYGTGDMILEHTVIPSLEFPARRPRDDIHWIQKIGLAFELEKSFEQVTWYGKGPIETYPDRKDGAKTGIYSEAFDNIHMPYIIPQDFGNKTDVKWLFVGGENGKGLAIFSEDVVNISVNPYENLGEVWYPFQLERKTSATLNVDFRVSGVGGTPITVRQPYRTYPIKYSYRLRLKPVDLKKDNIVLMGHEDF